MGTLGATAFYATYVNTGHRSRNGGYVPGTPFFDRAVVKMGRRSSIDTANRAAERVTEGLIENGPTDRTIIK